jgi:hypothetical protein
LKDAPANELLNDLDRHPHAFVLACAWLTETSLAPWVIYVVTNRADKFDAKALP